MNSKDEIARINSLPEELNLNNAKIIFLLDISTEYSVEIISKQYKKLAMLVQP